MAEAPTHGRCAVCGADAAFLDKSPRPRESFRCSECGANLRYRGQAAAMATVLGRPTASVADLVADGSLARRRIYEPGIVGPLRPLLGQLEGYMKSGYWEDCALGSERDGVRCEDLQQLSFDDGVFDLVISSDILEHVRRPFEAFSEVHRVLVNGGWHIFTVPVGWPLTAQTRSRVDTSTDKDILTLPPRYHASPTDPNGALVYTDFGMDLPDRLSEIGFTTLVHFEHTNAITFAACKTSASRGAAP